MRERPLDEGEGPGGGATRGTGGGAAGGGVGSLSCGPTLGTRASGRAMRAGENPRRVMRVRYYVAAAAVGGARHVGDGVVVGVLRRG